jgi:hypothetical protein
MLGLQILIGFREKIPWKKWKTDLSEGEILIFLSCYKKIALLCLPFSLFWIRIKKVTPQI